MAHLYSSMIYLFVFLKAGFLPSTVSPKKHRSKWHHRHLLHRQEKFLGTTLGLDGAGKGGRVRLEVQGTSELFVGILWL